MERIDERAAMGTPRALARVMPLSGIAAVVLLGVGFSLTGAFVYRQSASQAVEIFSADSARVQLGGLIGLYAVFFLMVFAASVAGAVRDATQDAGLAAAALAGGIVVALGVAFGLAFLDSAAGHAVAEGAISGETADVLYRLYREMFAGLLSIGLAVWIGATGLAALRSDLLPSWLGSASLVAAVGLLTPLHPLFEGLTLAWIVAVSVLLHRRASDNHDPRVRPMQRVPPQAST